MTLELGKARGFSKQSCQRDKQSRLDVIPEERSAPIAWGRFCFATEYAGTIPGKDSQL
jgi:hypothetical protein